MEKILFDSGLLKSKGRIILKYIVLAFVLCVIAIRVTYTEGPTAQSTTAVNLSDNLYTLSMSAVLFVLFVVWFVYGLCSRKFSYCFTTLEIGLCLFCLAAVIASFAASNRRTAITDSICLITPVLTAILLVQILDSYDKIKLVLTVIAALGVVCAYQCAVQLLVGNRAVIEQYEQAPQTILEPFGIQPGSIQQFLFEHRLYSRDVKGFFTTGNSAGAFAILASFAAIALFIDRLKNRCSQPSPQLPLVTCGGALVFIVFGLIITRSKGAISAFLIAAVVFVAFLYFGNWLKLHKRSVLLVCLLLFVVTACGVAAYGSAYGRLPGGNSMFVRWQYWYASAQMYADHALTGVGPGNFAHFYTHYKPAAATESVSNPHNILLSILTQYGPLGLVGFLALFFIPLWKFFPQRPVLSPQLQSQPDFMSFAPAFLIIISAVLLLIRPLIIFFAADDTFGVTIYTIFTLYVTPVIAFAVGFWLLTAGARTPVTSYQLPTAYTAAALFCAVLGLFLHGLIDFAIFEPPVFTALCTIIACFIAANFQQSCRVEFIMKSSLPVKIISIAAGLLLIWGYFNYALLPVAKTTIRIQQVVRQEQQLGERAHQLLYQAAEADLLDPTAMSLNGKLYLRRYRETPNPRPDQLRKAEVCFLVAVARDKADFKNYEKLGDILVLLANSSQPQEKTGLLNNALDYFLSAVECYPGSGDLRIKLAEVAEQLGKTDIALAQYEKAVEIEDAYRKQFRMMYPGFELLSRLGEEKYNHVKQRIKSLAGQPSR
jgi:hypothetical protein